MRSKLKPLTVALAFALAANSHAVWAADETKSTDDAAVTEMSPIQIRGVVGNYTVPVASTGTKTDTPLMETPVSVQVIPQQILQDQKAMSLDQALANVSGVRSSNVGWSENIYLRGFTTSTYFRDGFRIDDPTGLAGQASLSNVESIEVLKGPGSILYGRVEPGGVVNIITKQPQSTPHYSFEQSVGSWQHYITSVDATGPVTEDKTWLYSVNFSHDQSNSWMDNVNEKKDFIAPTLKWIPNGTTQVTIEASYLRNDASLYQQAQVPYDTATHQFQWGQRSANPYPSRYSPDMTFVGLNWSHDFNDDWSIRQQISHNQMDLSTPVNWGSSFGNLTLVGNTWMIDMNTTQGSGKTKSDGTVIDLTGHFDTWAAKHTLLVGADYYRMLATYDYKYSNPSGPFLTVPLFSSTVYPTSLIPLDPDTFFFYKSTTDSLGVYVQDQVKFPNRVQLLAGLRYQDVKNSSESIQGTNLYGGSGVLEVAPDSHDSAVTPRLGVLWQPRDRLSLYASYTENFGASNAATTDWQGKPLKPEGANQYEVGAKTETPDGKLNATVALFDLTKTNMIANDLDHPDGFGGFFQTNIGEIESKGVELTLQGEVSPGWDALAAYTYDRAIVTHGTSVYPQGTRTPHVPEQMLRLFTTYKLKGPELAGWKVGGGMTWQGEAPGMYVDPGTGVTDTTTIVTPSYEIFDAMASYEFRSGKYRNTFQVNVKNLFNKSYYTDSFMYLAPFGYVTYGEPRSVMASFKVEF